MIKNQDSENKRKRLAYQKSREDAGEKYESQVDQSLRRAGTRTYSVRVKIETIVAVYDCLDIFGGDSKGRGIGSNLVNVLTSCMESMQRDGLLPKHTNEEIVARYEEVSGTKLKQPLLNLPVKLTKEVTPQDVTTAIVDKIEEAREEEPEVLEHELYEVEDFSIGDVPDEEPLEDRIFQRTDDAIVQEASASGEEECKNALIKTYQTLPERLWGSASARTLYNANLKKEQI